MDPAKGPGTKSTPAEGSRRYRVLCLNHRDPRHPDAGGAERYLWEVLSRLDPARYEVTWRSERVRGRPSREALGPLRVVRRGGRLTLHLIAPFVAGGYDLVIESVAHAVPFHTGLTHRGPRIVLLYHVHQTILRRELPAGLAGVVRALERTVRFERADFVAISKTTGDEAQKQLRIRAPIEIIPPGVDHRVFTPGSTRTAPPEFVSLGRLRRYKRIEQVVEAFSALSGPGTLAIVGDGEDRTRLEQIAKRVPGVRFTGAVSEEQKVRLLQAATALVVTSEAEGFGLTILEAAATGTPAVAVDLPIYREVIQDQVSGRLVPEGDRTALTDALRWVRDHPELREGAAHAAARFTWEETARRFSREVETVLGSVPAV